MIHKTTKYQTTLTCIKSDEGTSIERDIERLLTSNEPIDGGSSLIYVRRQDGVPAEYDVRTDRWQIAQRAQDINTASKRAKRDNYYKTESGNGNENKETA